MTPRERLLQVAPLIWGENWQTAMPKELKVSRRTLVRYAHGRVTPSLDFLLLQLDATLALRIGAMASALEACAVLLMPDGSIVAYTAAGSPISREVPEDLRWRLSAILGELKDFVSMKKGPADAEE